MISLNLWWLPPLEREIRASPGVGFQHHEELARERSPFCSSRSPPFVLLPTTLSLSALPLLTQDVALPDLLFVLGSVRSVGSQSDQQQSKAKWKLVHPAQQRSVGCRAASQCVLPHLSTFSSSSFFCFPPLHRL